MQIYDIICETYSEALETLFTANFDEAPKHEAEPGMLLHIQEAYIGVGMFLSHKTGKYYFSPYNN